MRLNHIRCDGCGAEVRADDGAYRYWAKLTIDRSTHPQGSIDKLKEWDVCAKCVERASPDRWLREAAGGA